MAGCKPVQAGAIPAEDSIGGYASGQSSVAVNHVSSDFAGSNPCPTEMSFEFCFSKPGSGSSALRFRM